MLSLRLRGVVGVGTRIEGYHRCYGRKVALTQPLNASRFPMSMTTLRTADRT